VFTVWNIYIRTCIHAYIHVYRYIYIYINIYSSEHLKRPRTFNGENPMSRERMGCEGTKGRKIERDCVGWFPLPCGLLLQCTDIYILIYILLFFPSANCKRIKNASPTRLDCTRTRVYVRACYLLLNIPCFWATIFTNGLTGR